MNMTKVLSTTSKSTKAKAAPRKAFDNPYNLTRKQKAFCDTLLENKKISPTKAIMQTYGRNGTTPSKNTAAVMANENLTKPNIVSYLEDHKELCENTIINTIIKNKNSDDFKLLNLANENAKWVHDKIFGKAITKNISMNAAISIEDLLNDLK